MKWLPLGCYAGISASKLFALQPPQERCVLPIPLIGFFDELEIAAEICTDTSTRSSTGTAPILLTYRGYL